MNPDRHPIWRVSLQGPKESLNLLLNMLPEDISCEPYAGEHEYWYVLSPEDIAIDGEAARTRVSQVVAELNGVLRLCRPNCATVSLGARVQPPGENGPARTTHTFIVPSALEHTMDLPAAKSGDSPPRNDPCVLALMRKLKNNEPFRQAVASFAKPDLDFADLYVVVEFIRDGVPGAMGDASSRWNNLIARGYWTISEKDSFTATANYTKRHKPNTKKPYVLLALGAAKELVARMLRHWEQELTS
jgi:hypothetical protein